MVTPTTSAAEIQTKSRANLIPFIQKDDAWLSDEEHARLGRQVVSAREASRPKGWGMGDLGLEGAGPMITTGPAGMWPWAPLALALKASSKSPMARSPAWASVWTWAAAV